MSDYFNIKLPQIDLGGGNARQKVPTQTVSKEEGDEPGRVKELGAGLKGALIDQLEESQYGSFLRKIGWLEDNNKSSDVETEPVDEKADWRVRLSLPTTYQDPAIFKPLVVTNGLIFPYTPSVVISNSASYNAIKPVHSNYPFFAYQNSQAEQISISGDFTVEKEYDATYWLAAIHYLRSISKMSYGTGSTDIGSPPPVVKLNGYGKHVFNDVPVVLINFSTEMPNDVDYISVEMNGTKSHVPVRSTITVQLQPLYSRSTVQNFNLNDFVNGKYITTNGKFI